MASVYGKAGRAETATDPAPTEMFETIINLKPKEQWRAGLTIDGLIAELDKALQFPGVSNAWTMPIKARTDMLATGIRTPVGIKVLGTDLDEMEKLARQIETVVKTVPGTSSAYAERVIGGYYLDIVPDREALARYGLMVSDRAGHRIVRAWAARRSPPPSRAASATASMCAIRATCAAIPQSIARDVLISMPGGGTVPLGEVAEVKLDARPDLDPHRERPACASTSMSTSTTAISAAMSPTPRRRWPQASSSRRATMCMWSGQFEYLERADREAEDRRAGDAADHLPAALSQFRPADRNADRHAVAAVRAGRRALADVVARLQPVRRCGRRLHRPCRASRPRPALSC